MAFANFVAMAVTTSMYEKADESAEVVAQMMLVSGVDALKIAVIIANGDVANNVSSAKKKKKNGYFRELLIMQHHQFLFGKSLYAHIERCSIKINEIY